MLKKSSIPWPVKQLKSMSQNDRLNFEMAIQRKSNMWDIDRKSLLIHSLITGYPVPPFFCKTLEGIYYFIDGKQRMTSILSYLNDEFALSDNTPNVEGKEIIGMKFSELPEDLQKVLTNATLTITKFESITDEEVEEIFFRLNNGVTLKAIESTRVLLGNENMKIIEALTMHPFLLNKANISRNRYNDQEIILHIFMLYDLNDTGFSSKEVRNYVKNIKGKKISDELVNSVKEIFDYLDEGFEKKSKYLKKLNLPMICYVAKKAKSLNVDAKYFATWVNEFYYNLDKDSPYSIASQSGSAKKENVQKRLNEINYSYNIYF
ncbi:MAG: hypothetical protein K0R54_656 [Clostridiaceae bacterium]|jgi:Ca2+-binding EF-hand superfamily protein|nr:hypothetical protein [Clostridiaceae bacterium]